MVKGSSSERSRSDMEHKDINKVVQTGLFFQRMNIKGFNQ